MFRTQPVNGLIQQSKRSIVEGSNHAKLIRSVYTPPGGKSILEKRLPRKLRVGDTRPPIYYKFDCKVELSDGSTVTRKSQFPKVEWRYLADNRNSTKWNPTRRNVKAVESDATGRLAKFKQRFGFIDDISSSGSATEEKEPKASAGKEQPEEPKKDITDDYTDLMGENFVPVQSGGRLATKKRTKNKKKK